MLKVLSSATNELTIVNSKVERVKFLYRHTTPTIRYFVRDMIILQETQGLINPYDILDSGRFSTGDSLSVTIVAGSTIVVSYYCKRDINPTRGLSRDASRLRDSFP